MRRRLGLLIIGLLFVLGVQPAFSQAAEEYLPAAVPGDEYKEVIINIDGAPIKGDANANLILIEFSDYQCPCSVRHTRELAPQIDEEFVETGKLRHVFMDFPLSTHKNAYKAAVACLCARDQGMYWEMHDMLFNNPDYDPAYLETENLIKYAEEQKLSITMFKACLESGFHDAEINQRIDEGNKVGISSIPTFIVGFIQPDGTVKEVDRQVGAAKMYDPIKYLIYRALVSKQ